MNIKERSINRSKKNAKRVVDIFCFLVNATSYLRKKKKIEKQKIHKILLLNLQGIGDIVMTTPFLSALRRAFPKAEINYLCYKENGTVLEKDQRINTVIKRQKDGILNNDFLQTLKKIRKNNYDLIINLFPAQHSALLAILSNATYKIGNLYSTASTSNNLNVKKVKRTWDVRENCKNIAEQLELKEYDYSNLSITDEREIVKERTEMQNREKSKEYIAINPHATWVSKSWPDERWQELIEAILKEKRFKEYKIVIIGGPSDKEHTEEIIRSIEGKKNKEIENKKGTRNNKERQERIKDLTGKHSVKQTAALLKGAKLLITTDSGPMHIALAVKTPTIALFGCTDPNILVKGAKNITVISRYASCPKEWRFNHNNEPSKKAQEMMKQIAVEEVLEKVKTILRYKEKHHPLRE